VTEKDKSTSKLPRSAAQAADTFRAWPGAADRILVAAGRRPHRGRRLRPRRRRALPGTASRTAPPRPALALPARGASAEGHEVGLLARPHRRRPLRHRHRRRVQHPRR